MKAAEGGEEKRSGEGRGRESPCMVIHHVCDMMVMTGILNGRGKGDNKSKVDTDTDANAI